LPIISVKLSSSEPINWPTDLSQIIPLSYTIFLDFIIIQSHFEKCLFAEVKGLLGDASLIAIDDQFYSGYLLILIDFWLIEFIVCLSFKNSQLLSLIPFVHKNHYPTLLSWKSNLQVLYNFYSPGVLNLELKLSWNISRGQHLLPLMITLKVIYWELRRAIISNSDLLKEKSLDSEYDLSDNLNLNDLFFLSWFFIDLGWCFRLRYVLLVVVKWSETCNFADSKFLRESQLCAVLLVTQKSSSK
jgi:hypothetical protein